MQEKDRSKSGRRIFWIPILAVAAIALYVHFQKPPNPFHTVQSVLSVTPDQLKSRCGTPSQDTNGVVIPGDGIRDLYYNAGGINEVVFRFISADNGQTWQSLGGWIKVDEVGELGIPIDASDTARRLACVDKADESALSLPGDPFLPANPAARTGLSSSLSIILPATLATSLDFDPVPLPSASSETSADTRQSALACPPDAGPCELLTYSEFQALLNQAIQAERDNDYESAAQVFTGHGNLFVQLPASEAERSDAIPNIFKLEVKLLYVVESSLREDLGKLTGVSTDSPASQALKVAAVVQADQARRKLWKQSVEANPPAYSSGTSTHYDSGAFQQLVQIHQTGNWPS